MSSRDDLGRGTLMALIASSCAPEAEIRTYRTSCNPDSPYEYWPALELAQAIDKATQDGNDMILTGAAFSRDFPFLKEACQSAYLRNVLIFAPNGLSPTGEGRLYAGLSGGLQFGHRSGRGRLRQGRSSGSLDPLHRLAIHLGNRSSLYRRGISPSNAYAVSACGGLAALIAPKIPKTGNELPGQYVQRIAEIMKKSANPEILGFRDFNPKIGYGMIDAEKAVGPEVRTYIKK